MRRGLTALVGAGLLLASVPGTVGAAKVTRYTDQGVGVSCEGAVDGGFVSSFVEHGLQFGGNGFVDLWLDPAIPFEDPQTAAGSTDTDVDHTAAADNVTVTASWALTDVDGNPLGDGSMTANMVRVGDPHPEGPQPKSNHHSRTSVINQDLEGIATFELLGVTYEVPCTGTVSDISVNEANPTSFVSTNAGVQVDCIWIDGDAFTEFFAIDDGFGFFAQAFLFTSDGELDSIASTGSIDASAVNVALDLVDFNSGDTATATAAATFALLGDPVTSFLRQQNSQGKSVEQAMTVDGSFDVSDGRSYVMDTEHCLAESFANRSMFSQPKGPKVGAPPINDTPDGALAFKLGSRLNTSTTSTALEPEVEDFSACPQGVSDSFGHTLWYTFTGTGQPVTMDTSGSGFDTVIKAFTRDGDEFSVVGCEDDVTFQPIGTSFQAVLTIDTELGVTYYVEAGGFRRFFQPELVQSGRLRLAIY
jgi:hypothetical protein